MPFHTTGIAILCSAALSAGLQLTQRSRGLFEAADKIDVTVLMEPGCYGCNQLMTDSVKAAVSDEDTAAIMNLDINPFGNAYFAIPECRKFQEAAGVNSETGLDEYSNDARYCYEMRCATGVSDEYRKPAKNCYKGNVVWQFGGFQANSIEYYLCAKSRAKGNWQEYVPFIICMEEGHEDIVDEDSMAKVAQNCSHASGVDYFELESCRANKGFIEPFLKHAAKTPAHKGVPVVHVNGEEQDYKRAQRSIIDIVRSTKEKGGAVFVERVLPEKVLLPPAEWVSNSVWEQRFEHKRLHHKHVTDLC